MDTITTQPSQWRPVTPDDGQDLPVSPRGLWVNVAGNLALVGTDGTEAIFAVGAGQYIPLRPKRIKATGTTATGITALV